MRGFSKKMKKLLLWIIACGFGCIWILGSALFVFNDLHILEPEEQQKLKEGKTFWQWHSAYGPLDIHYVERGEGPNHLLFLHGFRAHTYTWRHLIDPLAKAGYHVWAIDLIGYGLSDKPDDAPYTIDFFAEQVKAFMDAKNISQAHFVGSSMGGGLALNVALTFPEQITSLTLIGALGYPLDLPFHLTIGRYLGQLWAPFMGPSIIRSGLEEIIFKKEMISQEQVDAYCLPYRFPGGITASLLTLGQFDNQKLKKISACYSMIRRPLLIVWGEYDTLIPKTHYEKFLADFPSAQCLLIPNCGHIPQEEEPSQVLSSLLNFLQEQPQK